MFGSNGMFRWAVAGCVLMGAVFGAQAADVSTTGQPADAGQVTTSGRVEVSQPWVRATVAQQQATGAFMTLLAHEASRLVGAESPVAAVVEVHEMAMDGQVMRMRQIDAVDLQPGQPTMLKPGGYHIMLIDLKQQIREGDQVPLTLLIETAAGQRERIALQAPVRALTAGPQGQGQHGARGHQLEAPAHQQGGHGHQHGAHAHHSVAPAVRAGVAPPQGVTVSECWIRAMPGRLPSAAYFRLRNDGPAPVRIEGVQADAYEQTMLHTTRTVDGMAVMAELTDRTLAPGQQLDFQPGGHHVMLERPRHEVSVGQSMPLTFVFEGGAGLTANCEVLGPAGRRSTR